MQRLKLLKPLKHALQRNGLFFNQTRTAHSLPSYTLLDHFQEQVLVEGRTKSRAAILNRPPELNAITTDMAARLNRLYESWEENTDIGFVLMKGSGKAFCSGTDVVLLRQLINEGKVEECKVFFQSLYNFVYLLGTYLKPHDLVLLLPSSKCQLEFVLGREVAILDGITMGGGAGISLPGMFRLVTDKTVFSTPEAQIGFHPDAGVSYHLSRLPGYLGEYLSLTGEKLNGVEMIACGLATHYSLKERLPSIEERLGKLMTDNRSVVESSLAQYGDLVYPDRRSVLHKLDKIDKCFSLDTVEEIVDALQEQVAAEPFDDWGTTTLRKMKEASPLSLKVTLQSIREGRFQPLDQCLEREYLISLNFISKRVSNDFCEGVRARLVDKDFAPKWDPPHLEDVTKDMVDSHFSRLSESEPDLNLATSVREPSA